MKKILSNLLTTTSLNVFTYLIPLVVTPYFLRVAGTENFALLSIAQSIVQYLILFVGFNLDATVAGDIAIIKNDKEELRRVFWQTTYARFVLLIIASAIFVCILLFSFLNQKNVSLLNLTYLGLLGYAITPLWFYQGTEKFTQLFLFVAIGKILFAIIVFSCITHSEDFWYYSLGLSISQIVSGLLLFWYPVYKYKLKRTAFSVKETFQFLRQKFLLFKGGTMVNFCMNINVTILSILLSLQDFGLYMAANKLILVLFTLVTLPLNQSLYPYMSRTITKNKEAAILKIRNVLVPGVTYVAITVCAGLFLFSKLLILVMLGSQFLDAEIAFKLMLFSLIANVLTNVITLQLFIKLNFFKAYTKITQLSAFLSVFLTLVCAWAWGVNGAAFAWLLSEFFLLAYSAVQLNGEGLKIFSSQSLHPKAVYTYWTRNKLSFLRK